MGAENSTLKVSFHQWDLAEGVDLRTLSPLDEVTILSSVARTGRLVVVDECPLRCGIASEVAAVVAEAGFGLLKAPVSSMTRAQVSVPYSPPLEAAVTPDASKIVAAVRRTLGLERWSEQAVCCTTCCADARCRRAYHCPTPSARYLNPKHLHGVLGGVPCRAVRTRRRSPRRFIGNDQFLPPIQPRAAWGTPLIPERSITSIKPADDGLPLGLAMVALHEALELLCGLFAHLRQRLAHFLAGRLHAGLHFSHADQIVHQHDGLANRLTARQEPVISQDENVVPAKVATKTLALVQVNGNAFKIMIADAIVEHHRVLAEIAQPPGVRG